MPLQDQEREDRIIQTLKRLEGCLIQVWIRGGKVCKIPAQEIKCQTRDGVQDIKIISQDIE
jgi:hypothetical protein